MSRSDSNYILTYTGRKFYPLDPHPEDVSIRDIAHHLSMTCRFTGAVNHFYSVAEHSVRVSLLVPTLQALLHDSPEAYLLDCSRPVKHDDRFGMYRDAENHLWYVISSAFGVPAVMDQAIHKADNLLLLTEKRDLLHSIASIEDWGKKWALASDAKPLPGKIRPLSPEIAEEWFLDRFFELGGSEINVGE